MDIFENFYFFDPSPKTPIFKIFFGKNGNSGLGGYTPHQHNLAGTKIHTLTRKILAP